MFIQSDFWMVDLSYPFLFVSGNFGTVFVDQSYWQSSVAAKPNQGVLGFLSGGLCWFAIPFGLATTVGLAYIALSTSQNTDLLTESEINAGTYTHVLWIVLFYGVPVFVWTVGRTSWEWTYFSKLEPVFRSQVSNLFSQIYVANIWTIIFQKIFFNIIKFNRDMPR